MSGNPDIPGEDVSSAPDLTHPPWCAIAASLRTQVGQNRPRQIIWAPSWTGPPHATCADDFFTHPTQLLDAGADNHFMGEKTRRGRRVSDLPLEDTRMSTLGHEILIRTKHDEDLASSRRRRLHVARVVLRQAKQDRLLAFRLQRARIFLVVVADRGPAGQLARRIEIALARGLGLTDGFARAEPRPIDKQWLLGRTFSRVLGMGDPQADPLHEGSNLPDLLGLRLPGRYTAASVRRLLPRVHREELLQHLGVPELQPANGPLEYLLPAAAAALGHCPLEARSSQRSAAHRAAIEIVNGRLGTGQLAALLGVSDRTVERLRIGPVDEQLVEATRLQLCLVQQVGLHY
jgi:hypothetical protein